MIRSAPSTVARRSVVASSSGANPPGVAFDVDAAAHADRGELRFVDVVESQPVTHQAEICDEAEAAGTCADDGDWS